MLLAATVFATRIQARGGRLSEALVCSLRSIVVCAVKHASLMVLARLARGQLHQWSTCGLGPLWRQLLPVDVIIFVSRRHVNPWWVTDFNSSKCNWLKCLICQLTLPLTRVVKLKLQITKQPVEPHSVQANYSKATDRATGKHHVLLNISHLNSHTTLRFHPAGETQRL